MKPLDCSVQVDAEGKRYDLSGEYTFVFGVKETAAAGGYVEHSFTAV